MGGIDHELLAMEARKRSRTAVQCSLRSVRPRYAGLDITEIEAITENDEDSVSDSPTEPEFTPRRTSTPTRSIALYIPAQGLTKHFTPLADRLRLSSRELLAIQSKVITVGGANVEQTKLSLTTVRRQRTRTREEISERIRNNFVPPQYPSIHWDGKLIQRLSGKKEDRIAVFISGYSDRSTKLLGIPPANCSTGLAQCDITVCKKMNPVKKKSF
mgnify:FL=1